MARVQELDAELAARAAAPEARAPGDNVAARQLGILLAAVENSALANVLQESLIRLVAVKECAEGAEAAYGALSCLDARKPSSRFASHVQTAAGSHVFELFVGTNVLFRMSQKVSRKHTDAEFVVIRKGASRTGSCTVMTGS